MTEDMKDDDYRIVDESTDSPTIITVPQLSLSLTLDGHIVLDLCDGKSTFRFIAPADTFDAICEQMKDMVKRSRAARGIR